MSSTAHLDQGALANLTAEEREAFNDSEYSEAEKASLKRLAGDDDGDDDGGDPNEVLDADGKPVAAASAPDKSVPVDTPAAAGATDPVVPNVDPVEPVAVKAVVYKAVLPEDFDAKVKDLSDKSAALRAQFKGGDIEFDAFEEQNAALLEERDALTMTRVKAEVSQEMTQQQAEQSWNSAIDRLFTSAAKDGGIDYKASPERNAELDQFVKALANNPANQDKSMDWFLTEAHRRVLVLNGTPLPPVPKADPTSVVPAAQNRNPPAAPKTIAQIPGGDGPGDVGGEFAHLDALGGDDLEAAIAKMTPAQREKFSRGQ